MLEYSEKRTYIRMETDCDMTYKFPQSDQTHHARCINLSGAGILFNTQEAIEPGLAVEVCVTPQNNVTPAMTAFIEISRCSPIENDQYEIAASIKGIKAD